MTEAMPETIDEVINTAFNRVLRDELIDDALDCGGLVDHPKRPIPTDKHMELGYTERESNGRRQNEQRTYFDGYVLTWRAVPYPHIPSIKTYELQIARDGQVFFEREQKAFEYAKSIKETIDIETKKEAVENPTGPFPERVFIETHSLFPDRNGRQAVDFSLRFDGYHFHWQPKAFPHKPSVMSYVLNIERDGQQFFEFKHKVFGY